MMDPNLSGLIEAMKVQQEQFMAAITNLNRTERVVSPPAFEHFDKAKEKWEQYLKRLNQHLELHNVVEQDKKRAFLLSCIDSSTFTLLESLFGSSDLSNKSFNELTAKLTVHFQSSVHVQAARYSFYNCKMAPGQSYADWVATLRGIAKD